MSTAFDLDYLGLAPATSNGVGVGFITFRGHEGPRAPLTVQLQRAALERLRDDIDSLLATNSDLSNQRTMNKAILERVVVPPEVLEQFGVFDYEYTGGSE